LTKKIDTKGKLTSRGQATDEGLILEILINELSSVKAFSQMMMSLMG
jgi:hypothetical protein